jgi:anti-sigma factor RsiW
MEITRNVILDILPLYLAGEVSADTRALVEKYLETDEELDSFVKRSSSTELSSEVPVPLTMDDEIEAYKKAQWFMLLRTVLLAIFMAAILLAVLAAFLFSS